MSDPTEQDELPGNAPKLNQQTFVCPHCGAFTGQDWDALYFNGFNGLTDVQQPRNAGRISAAQCAKCHWYSIWQGATMIYPAISTAPLPHGEMPDDVLELYDEAAAVLPHSRRATAALVRASLERLLKDLDTDAPKNTNLFGYIDRVQSRVSTHLGQLLTIIRHIGNSALHEGARDDDESVQMFLYEEDTSYVELLFEATNYVVDELISRPKLVSKMYAKLPPNVRQSAEDAAAKSAANKS